MCPPTKPLAPVTRTGLSVGVLMPRVLPHSLRRHAWFGGLRVGLRLDGSPIPNPHPPTGLETLPPACRKTTHRTAPTLCQSLHSLRPCESAYVAGAGAATVERSTPMPSTSSSPTSPTSSQRPSPCSRMQPVPTHPDPSRSPLRRTVLRAAWWR